MAKSFSEIAAERRAEFPAEAKVWKDVLGEAYDIAVQVMTLREERGLTQGQLAELSGIDQADISRIERGAANPTAKTLQRIADALDSRVALIPN